MAMPPVGPPVPWQNPQHPLPVRPPAPPAMMAAVRLMYAGAAVGLAAMVAVGLTTHEGMFRVYTVNSAGTVHDSATGAVISGVIVAALWLWMAWKNSSGRPWARILSTVFFCLLTLTTIGDVVAAPAVAKVLLLVQWGIGLAATIFMWHRDSTMYYGSSRGRI